MTLEDLGYHVELEAYRAENNLEDFGVGRVSSEHRERYSIHTGAKELEAEIVGRLRFSAEKRSDFPAVGDWVAFSAMDENTAVIHAVYPRRTLLERTAVGKTGEKQVIAANIDQALILQAVDRDYSINRIERYLAICYNADIDPVVIISKTDLVPQETLATLLLDARQRLKNVPVLEMSNKTGAGYDELKDLIIPGRTFCLLGSSGVGKSTLLNNLSGRQIMKTESIGEGSNRGRHTTSHRELFVLEGLGIFIDNPGMREVGIADSDKGLERGEIDPSSYENYLKMEKERMHFRMTEEEKRRRDKSFGKIMKDYKKFRDRNE